MDIGGVPASDVMGRVLVTVTPEESPLLAWEYMRRGDIGRLRRDAGRSRT